VNNLTLVITPVNGDYVWNGSVSNDWTTLGNWYSYNGTNYIAASSLPTSSIDIIIPGNGTCILNQPNTLGNTVDTKNITIEASAVLTMGSGVLNVSGNWLKHGTFTSGTGTVNFNGTTAQSIGRTGVLSSNFYNVTFNNTSTGITLTSSTTVVNGLTMIQGNIFTTITNYLFLPGTLNWTAGTIVGPMRRWFDTTTNSGYSSGLFPIGTAGTNNWLMFEYTSAPGNPRIITAQFIPNNPTSTSASVNGMPLIDAGPLELGDFATEGYWEIYEEFTPSGSPGTYTLTARANQFASILNYTDSRIIKSPDPHSTWTLQGSHGTISGSATDFTISRTGLSNFSFFAIGIPSADPLPIELLNFQANCNEQNEINISWATASENNTSHFEIEKSRDGISWELLNIVAAAGNSTSLLEYSIVDNNVSGGNNYYRLNQFDLNGSSKTYNIASENCFEKNVTSQLNIYPNPSNGDFYMNFFTDNMQGEGVIVITDSRSSTVFSQNVSVKKGSNIFHIDNLKVEPGVYYVHISNGTSNTNIVKHIIH